MCSLAMLRSHPFPVGSAGFDFGTGSGFGSCSSSRSGSRWESDFSNLFLFYQLQNKPKVFAILFCLENIAKKYLNKRVLFEFATLNYFFSFCTLFRWSRSPLQIVNAQKRPALAPQHWFQDTQLSIKICNCS